MNWDSQSLYKLNSVLIRLFFSFHFNNNATKTRDTHKHKLHTKYKEKLPKNECQVTWKKENLQTEYLTQHNMDLHLFHTQNELKEHDDNQGMLIVRDLAQNTSEKENS